MHNIALGGGSRVRVKIARTSVGPDSVGSNLDKEGIAFGGQTLTVSDTFMSSSMCTDCSAVFQGSASTTTFFGLCES